MLSHKRLDYGLFWQEPAITGLDWLFTPSRKLEEHLYVAPLQASTRFYPHFTLLTVRSPGFGSYPCDLWHFHTNSLAEAAEFLLSLRVLVLNNYPCHIDKLPGTLFKTHDTTTNCSITLSLSGFKVF